MEQLLKTLKIEAKNTSDYLRVGLTGSCKHDKNTFKKACLKADFSATVYAVF